MEKNPTSAKASAGAKTGKYVKYAIGEIVLVVIGILIAVNINNWNKNGIARTNEIKYLKNIQADLNAELKNNEFSIKARNYKADFAQELRTAPFVKTKAEQFELYRKQNFVFGWSYFVPTNNTFKELSSSGQLNSISSDSIKHYLLEIDKIYTGIANAEHHMRREYEQYLYDIAIPNTTILMDIDFDKTVSEKKNTPIQSAKQLSENQFMEMKRNFISMRNNLTYQNGLKLATLNNISISKMHHSLEDNINRLNTLISEEIKRN